MSQKITTPTFRAAFVSVFSPMPPMAGQEATRDKYGLTALFDSEAQATEAFAAMQKLAVAAAKEKWGDKLRSDGHGWFAGVRNPIRDGAEKAHLEGFEGSKFCSLTTTRKPGVVDQGLNFILSSEVSPDGFYSGAFARATITAFAYDKAGNKGVSFSLNNIQKMGEGEPFAGAATRADNDFERVSAADDF